MSAALVSLLSDVTKHYVLYIDIILLIVGVLGNLCNVVVFVTARCFRGKQCVLCIILESICSIGLFLSIFPANFYQLHTGIDPGRSLVWCKLRSGLTNIFAMCALFTICFQTFDQFMSTNPRPNYRQISSLKLARRFLLGNIIFVILHSTIFAIFYQIDSSGICTISHPALTAYNKFFYYPILISALPLITTVTFSLLAYRNVRRIVRRQISLVRRRLDRQLTAMVLARVVSLNLLGLPYIAYQLYQLDLHVTESNQVQIAISSLVSVITNSLLYLNFATTFYLFLAVSARFRRQVRQVLAKTSCTWFACWSRATTIARNENQVAPEMLREAISNVSST